MISHSTIEPGSRIYRGADKSLARPTSRCILFDGENISFHASLVIYINNTNIPPITIINGIYETPGESNGKLLLRTCPGCSVPEPYQSPD